MNTEPVSDLHASPKALHSLAAPGMTRGPATLGLCPLPIVLQASSCKPAPVVPDLAHDAGCADHVDLAANFILHQPELPPLAAAGPVVFRSLDLTSANLVVVCGVEW